MFRNSVQSPHIALCVFASTYHMHPEGPIPLVSSWERMSFKLQWECEESRHDPGDSWAELCVPGFRRGWEIKNLSPKASQDRQGA